MALFDPQKTREQYLAGLLARYGTVTLPIATNHLHLPLHTVFQPMILRRDPLVLHPAGSVAEIVRARDSLEALQRSEHGRMVVLGGPGMGKSTALKALLYGAIIQAQDDPLAPLPVFISLPDLARIRLSLELFLRGICTELALPEEFAEVIQKTIHSGQAFLCLDSLDEVLPAQRPDVIAFLNKEALRCQGKWIVGSRFTEYKGGQFAYGQFAEWELQPLDEQARLALACQLLPALSQALAHMPDAEAQPDSLLSTENYLACLDEHRHISTWGENPLMFSLAALLYVQNGHLPDSRAVLYAQVTEAMLAMRLHKEEQRRQVEGWLAELALAFYQTRGRNFTLEDGLNFVDSLDTQQSSQERYHKLQLILDAGVLEPAGYQTYGFKHQMFQEYLAALALARRCLDESQYAQAWELLWRKRRLSRWNEILRLLVGILVHEAGNEGVSVVRAWLSALIEEQQTSEGDPGDLCLILAMNSLSEFGEQVNHPPYADLTQHILDRWQKRLTEHLHQGNYHPLYQLADILRSFDLQVVAPIVLHFQTYEHYTRGFQSLIVGSSTLRYLPPVPLLQYLFQDQPISFYASHTLPALKTPQVIEKLISMLEKREERWKREDLEAALVLLGKMEELAPITLLQQVWEDTAQDENLRHAAAEALREAQNYVPYSLFVAMLSDSAESIRFTALKALSSNTPVDTELFLLLLKDPSELIRREVLIILYEQQVTLSLEQLQALLADESDRVRKAVWSFLQQMTQPLPVELWLDALKLDYEDVRDQALLALGQYRDQLSVEMLMEMLTHPPEEVFRPYILLTHYAKVLALLEERVPVDHWLELLEHRYDTVQAVAVAALAQRKIVPPVDLLLSMLDSSRTGEEAVQALALLGAEAPIPALLEKAESPHFYQANFATKALCLLYKHVPTEAVYVLLENEHIRERAESYWHLLQLLELQGQELPLELLVPALKALAYQDKERDALVGFLTHAGKQAPLDALLRLAYEEGRGQLTAPKWIGQVFYILHQWVTSELLSKVLNNTARDQWLAVSMLNLTGDEAGREFLKEVAQNPSWDRLTRSEAIVALSDAGYNFPLPFLADAIHWSPYEGMEYILNDTVKRLASWMPIEELLPFLVRDGQLRLAASEALSTIAEYTPLERVLPFLANENKTIMWGAIRILGAMRERAPLAILAGILHDPEQSLDTRCTVLTALGEAGTPAAVDLLIAALQDEKPEIKYHALYALKDDEFQSVRGSIRAFKEYGKEIPLTPLMDLLDDPDTHIVQSAIKVLGALGSMGAAIPPEPLLGLLDHEDGSIAEEAIEALCTLGEQTPLAVLIAYMQHNDDESLCSWICYQLASTHPQACLEVILEKCLDENKYGHYRQWTMDELARSVPEQILQRLADDRRPISRRAVLMAIQTNKDCTWLPLVLETLHDVAGDYTAYDHQISNSQHSIHAEAVTALGSLHACAPVEPLITLLNKNAETFAYHDERLTVLKALNSFGADVPLEALLPLLGSAHEEICKLAFEHIQQFYPSAAAAQIPHLKAIINGEPLTGPLAPRIAYRMAEMVALMGRATPELMDMVIALLDHPFWEVRERAAKTLGTLRRNIPDRAIHRLLEMRKDPESPNVCIAADEALAEILSLEQGLEDE